jgi:hypothetical protein
VQDDFISYIIPKYMSSVKVSVHALPRLEDRYHDMRFVHCGMGVYHVQVPEFLEALAFKGLV